MFVFYFCVTSLPWIIASNGSSCLVKITLQITIQAEKYKVASHYISFISNKFCQDIFFNSHNVVDVK